jgi:hypothetical protein
MSYAFGSRRYGEGVYGGAAANEFTPCIPVQVWVWTRTGTFKGMYQSGASPLVSIDFTHTERGCGDFTLEFAEVVDIAKSDTIKIKVFDVVEYLFCGVVRSIPILGSTKNSFIYSGFGYNDYLKRLNAGALNYASKTVGYIVGNIVSTIVSARSSIIYNAGKIYDPGITITTFRTNYSSVLDALDALLKIANSTGNEYLYGVDKEGDFFFRPRYSGIIATLVPGRLGNYGIPAYEPEDSSEEITKLFVLKKSGAYWTTLSSTAGNDVYEDKVTGPDIADADLTLWATGILKDKERTIRSASIEWPLFIGSPLVLADGWIRIVSTVPPPSQITALGTAFGDSTFGDGYFGGSDYPTYYNIDDTLAIKQIRYSINSQGANRSIDLGAIPLRLENAIVDVNKKTTDLQISLGM